LRVAVQQPVRTRVTSITEDDLDGLDDLESGRGEAEHGDLVQRR
jgi:hypothetical protein